jgi:peptide/nickel transport system substrate-binding protein
MPRAPGCPDGAVWSEGHERGGDLMTTARFGSVRLVAAPLLALSLLLPVAAPAAAADPVVLRVGTTQDLDASNPFNTYLVSGYEVFQLTYNLLVDFDKDAKPAPGFAESWTREPDKVVFKIREGMKWSDGTPATSKDACYSWGLAVAAIADETNVGAGYLDPGVADAGVTKLECPDDTTFIAYTTDQSERIFQVYVPIIPAHVYGEKDYTAIAEDTFDPPLVGTGPYILQEWKTGQFARFTRNPEYWGPKGFADEVVIQFFGTDDTMVQALKAGEIDYARNVNANQLKQLQADPAFTTVVGKANGWTQLAFNTYGTGTGKTIEGGGPSTKALLDQAFRDAIGYAVDKEELVERVLGGYGDPGDTIIPPILSEWHVTPDNPRSFNLDMAKQKLEAAGYVLDADGKRLDKEGKPISLRLVTPNTEANYATAADFVRLWYDELGIGVTVEVLDSSTVGERVLPPEANSAEGDNYIADYDIELWGWAGNPDPSALLDIFQCDQIGNTSDSQYCNPEFDSLYALQLTQTGAERAATLAKMQNLIYNEAPYDILYYDANLDVYRTDRFAGWQNMPSDGTPLFSYGTLQYSLLTDAAAAGGPNTTLLVIVIGAVVVIGILFIWLISSRRRKGEPQADE